MADIRPLQILLAQGRADNHPVAIRNGQAISFANFSKRTAAWHSAFASRESSRWALYLQDAAEFASALLGAWHAGKCIYLPGDATAGTISKLRQEVDGFVGEFPGVNALQASCDESPVDWQPLDISHTGVVVYTSGSSGDPVAIPKKLEQLFREVSVHAECWADLLSDSLILSTVSQQHIYGLMFRILLPLASGRPFDSARLAYPESVLAQIELQDSVLISSPAHLKRIPAHLPWHSIRTHLRAVFSSGGQLPDTALQDCRTLLGQAPIEIYGSSETGGIAWRRRDSDIQAAWHPLPEVEVRMDGSGCALRSPFLPEPGWTMLADALEPNGEGFTLLGRQDRVVKIEERRVSLGMIERLLTANSLVNEARALMISGERTVLGVVVVPSGEGWKLYETAGKHALNKALRTCLESHMEASVIPRRWRYAWSLPIDTQGKCSEQRLGKLFDPRHPSACLLMHNEHEAHLRLDVPSDIPYFDGHFPSAPVLPGLAQVDWALRLGRELFDLPPDFISMENLKFQKILQPGCRPVLMLKKQAHVLSFTLSSDAGRHASGQLHFGEAT